MAPKSSIVPNSDPFTCPFSEQIWDMKYRLKDPAGVPIDGTVEDSWRRVAWALADAETDPDRWDREFYNALEGFRFLPAGRILAGTGTGRSVTLFNCFVMGTIPDSMDGIFAMLKEAALTMQQGGGIGYDFSTLRPKGAPVVGVGADASGPLSFMDVWDSMCRTIMSAGSRRGAMMATMRCDHPDIEDFIAAKSDPARLRMFNLSVLATDPFMEAVKADRGWDLVFADKVWKTVRARDLWNRIMESTFGYAEPGVIFIDRINQRNNLHYCETISATNPCGEQPLPPYGACLLGSINLARLVKDPFEWGQEGLSRADIDEDELDRLVTTAVRMMDNVIDVSRFPLAAQRQEAHAKRRIGLGVTGLADALLMSGKRYGSNEAASLAQFWMGRIARAAYLASAELAAEKGPFPLYERETFMAGRMMQSMDGEVREAVSAHGIRNALLTSIAPTGTISLLAGNVSSGIEPVFAYSYNRKVLQPDGSDVEEEIVDYAVRLWREKNGDKPLPDNFVDAQTLKPEHHVRMQAAVQEWVDSSISKTINCPADIAFEEFQAVYMSAWDQGCKGCTTYRPNEVTGSVLSVGETEVPAVVHSPAMPANVEPLARPEALEGRTYKIKWPGSEHALYVTINDALHSGRRIPFEIFINSKNMEHYPWTLALTRMISAVFRRGGDVRFVAEELRAVFDPTGGAWMGGRYVPSILALLGDVIEQHLSTVGYEGGDFHVRLPEDPPGAQVVGVIAASGYCSACGSLAVVRREGCLVCRECGHSKCQ